MATKAELADIRQKATEWSRCAFSPSGRTLMYVGSELLRLLDEIEEDDNDRRCTCA